MHAQQRRLLPSAWAFYSGKTASLTCRESKSPASPCVRLALKLCNAALKCTKASKPTRFCNRSHVTAKYK